jgi:hypothetical protein
VPQIDIALWKEIGLLACFGIFMIIALRLLFTRRGKYDRAAQLPLDDESKELHSHEERGRNHG